MFHIFSCITDKLCKHILKEEKKKNLHFRAQTSEKVTAKSRGRCIFTCTNWLIYALTSATKPRHALLLRYYS